jgi:hypothetical protein
MSRRAKSWTTHVTLLLWQLGGGFLAPATFAMSPRPATAGEAVHHCAGHESRLVTLSVDQASDHSPASRNVAPHGQPPCCGGDACKCHGAPTGLALSFTVTGPMLLHPAAPAAPLELGHPSCGPSDPFRPPIH